MLRKTITAAAAALTLGAAALAPNSASAWAGHPGLFTAAWCGRPMAQQCDGSTSAIETRNCACN